MANNLKLGTVNGTPIVADLDNGLYPGAAVKVTLSATYDRSVPPGYPQYTAQTAGVLGPPNSENPATLTEGSTIYFLKPEADALVQAGAATYA